MCWNRVIVWHRCIAAFKFKTTLVSALFLLFLLYCILDPSKSEYPVKKRRTLKRVFEERRERMENYCDADKSTPKTPLRELLPPKKPNFHILENLRRPILLCAPKKVSGDIKAFWIQITWTQGWLDDLLLGLSHSPWRRWWGELGIGTKQVQKVKMHHIENNKTKPKTLRAQQRHLAANLRIGIYNGEMVLNRLLRNCWSDLDDFFCRPAWNFNCVSDYWRNVPLPCATSCGQHSLSPF